MKYITRNNYEEFALDYLEGTISLEDRIEFESFLYDHPDLKQDIEQMSIITLVPPQDIEFPDKESLYQEDKSKTKVFWLPLIRVAATIVLVSTVFVLWSPTQKLRQTTRPPIVVQESKSREKPVPIVNNAVELQVKDQMKSNQVELSSTHKNQLGSKAISTKKGHIGLVQLDQNQEKIPLKKDITNENDDFLQDHFDHKVVVKHTKVYAIAPLQSKTIQKLDLQSETSALKRSKRNIDKNQTEIKRFAIVLPDEVYPETWKQSKAISINTSKIPRSFIPETFLK